MPTYVRTTVQEYPGNKLIQLTQVAQDVVSDEGGDEDDGAGDDVEDDAGRTKEQTLCQFICEAATLSTRATITMSRPQIFSIGGKPIEGRLCLRQVTLSSQDAIRRLTYTL